MKKAKRCAFCRCTSVAELYGFRVCRWHQRHGENQGDCPICATIGNPRWTYTVNGELPPKKVEVRQVVIPKSVFLNDNREMVLSVQCVKEPAPLEWPNDNRLSVVMIGLGQQIGPNYTITQWASDWERELLDAARPRLALASKIYVESRWNFDADVLAGQWVSALSDRWGDAPLWPAIDVRSKVVNVYDMLREQNIGPQLERPRNVNARGLQALWQTPKGERAPLQSAREIVWRTNYLDVLETSMKVFQIEWPVN